VVCADGYTLVDDSCVAITVDESGDVTVTDTVSASVVDTDAEA